MLPIFSKSTTIKELDEFLHENVHKMTFIDNLSTIEMKSACFSSLLDLLNESKSTLSIQTPECNLH